MLQESPKDCNEATVPTEIPDDVKAECGDLEVVYVKSVDCPAGIVDFKLFHFPIFCLWAWPDKGHCVPDKGHCVLDKGHYELDKGNCVPDKGHCVPDKGNCRYTTCILN